MSGLLCSNPAHQTGFDQWSQQIERALFRYAERVPDLARGERLVFAQEMEELLLSRPQHQLRFSAARRQFLDTALDPLQRHA